MELKRMQEGSWELGTGELVCRNSFCGRLGAS